MDITEITDDMIGKKITCYIHGTFIDDGEIDHDGEFFVICHNICNGRHYKNKNYKYTWRINYSNNPGNDGVTSIKLKEPLITPIELWI
jgi:hypothetical protein